MNKCSDCNDGRIFVYGSNLRGRNGAGAALHAAKAHGAVEGVGKGRTGNAYAIPTKSFNIKTLPLEVIEKFVRQFIEHAKANPELRFHVTAIGTGLAGYAPEKIAPMFAEAPENCDLPEGWRKP